MSTTATERAPWTGSTADYDEAIGALARAQHAFMEAHGLAAEKAALRAVREARKAVDAAVEDMVAWSTSRAYLEILHHGGAEATR